MLRLETSISLGYGVEVLYANFPFCIQHMKKMYTTIDILNIKILLFIKIFLSRTFFFLFKCECVAVKNTATTGTVWSHRLDSFDSSSQGTSSWTHRCFYTTSAIVNTWKRAHDTSVLL